MDDRFSIAGMFGALGRMLKAHGVGILAITVVYVLARAVLDLALGRLPNLDDAPVAYAIAADTAGSLIRLALGSLVGGALLHLVLAQRSVSSAASAALSSFPAIYLMAALISLPAIASTGLAAMIQAPDATLKDMAMTSLLLGLAAEVVGLAIYAFIGPAAAIAVTETRSPRQALGGALQLTRGRRWPLFWIQLGLVVFIIILHAIRAALLALMMKPIGFHPTITSTMHALTGVLSWLVLAAIYRELRRARPGEAAA